MKVGLQVEVIEGGHVRVYLGGNEIAGAQREVGTSRWGSWTGYVNGNGMSLDQALRSSLQSGGISALSSALAEEKP